MNIPVITVIYGTQDNINHIDMVDQSSLLPLPEHRLPEPGTVSLLPIAMTPTHKIPSAT